MAPELFILHINITVLFLLFCTNLTEKNIVFVVVDSVFKLKRFNCTKNIFFVVQK